MTYPNPYQPPQMGYGGYQPQPNEELLAPARRAAMLMFLVAALGVFGAILLAWKSDQIAQQIPWSAEQQSQLQQLNTQSNITPGNILAITFGCCVGLPSLIFFILGFVVRSGGRASCIFGIVLGILVAGIVGLQALSLVANGAVRTPFGLLGEGIFIIALVLLGVMIVSLFQAVFNAPKLHGAALAYQQQYQQYQQQYWQYAQQQQQQQQSQQPNPYAQAYGLQPPPPPPPGQGMPPQPPAGQPPVSPPSDQPPPQA